MEIRHFEVARFRPVLPSHWPLKRSTPSSSPVCHHPRRWAVPSCSAWPRGTLTSFSRRPAFSDMTGGYLPRFRTQPKPHLSAG